MSCNVRPAQAICSDELMASPTLFSCRGFELSSCRAQARGLGRIALWADGCGTRQTAAYNIRLWISPTRSTTPRTLTALPLSYVPAESGLSPSQEKEYHCTSLEQTWGRRAFSHHNGAKGMR